MPIKLNRTIRFLGRFRIHRGSPYLRFVFLTGVSKFAKTGIFAGLNNLKDITVDTRYSAVCGYRQSDLETVFREWLECLDLDDVRDWYNGYSWTGESVYTPV